MAHWAWFIPCSHCLPCFMCFVYVYPNTDFHLNRERKRQRKKREKFARGIKESSKPPHVIPRPRRLTITNVVCDNDLKPQFAIEEQEKCNLFRLPYELRLGIYEAIIGAQKFHIIWRDSRVRAFRCQLDLLDDAAHDHLVCVNEPSRPVLEVLPIMQTCRRLYSEFTPFLYSKPTFAFHDWSSFLGFCASILPQRFQSITSVHIDTYSLVYYETGHEQAFRPLLYTYEKGIACDFSQLHISNELPVGIVEERHTYWTAICEMLSRMSGLRKLELGLDRLSIHNGLIDEQAVLEPLIAAHAKLHLHEFSVTVGWKPFEYLAWEMPPERPFEICRIPAHFQYRARNLHRR